MRKKLLSTIVAAAIGIGPSTANSNEFLFRSSPKIIEVPPTVPPDDGNNPDNGSGPILSISTVAENDILFNKTVSEAGFQQPSATNAQGSVSWKINNSERLPPGVSFNAALGKFEGIPTTLGGYGPVTLTATDDKRSVTSKAVYFTVLMNNDPISLEVAGATTKPGLPVTTPAPGYSNTIQGLRFFSNDLAGTNLSVNSSTGVMTGTLSQVGLTDVDLTVTDDTGRQTTRPVQFTVLPTMTMSVPTSIDLMTGTAMTPLPVNTEHAVGVVTWDEVASDKVPPGVVFNTTSGTFEGTPLGAGTYGPVTVSGVDTMNDRANSNAITLVVTNPRLPVGLTVLSEVTVTADKLYKTREPAAQFSASNIMGSATWSVTGLPNGLSIDPAAGILTGTVTNSSQQGIHNVRVTVKDSYDNAEKSADFTISVVAPFTTLDYLGQTISTSGAMAKGGFNVRGAGNTPYTGKGLTAVQVTGTKPNGISVSGTTDTELVLFSGTPTTPGTYTSTWRITDKNGWSITPPEVTFVVQAGPVLQVWDTYDKAIEGTVTYTSASPVRTFTAKGLVGSGEYTAIGLPAGLVLSTAGVVTGTVTDSAFQGVHYVTINVRDTANNKVGSDVWKLTINAPFFTFGYTGGTLKVGTPVTGQAYNFRDSKSNGAYLKAKSGTLISGALPPGMNVTAPTGTEFLNFTGTPTQKGTYQSVWKLEIENGWFLIAPQITFVVNQ